MVATTLTVPRIMDVTYELERPVAAKMVVP
jgi:hypothetical protein